LNSQWLYSVLMLAVPPVETLANVCFARRKRRYEGRYNNREGGDGMALAKRLKRDVRPEDEKNSDALFYRKSIN
jgi:hypothetical protein